MTLTRGIRWVQDPYNGHEEGTRYLQWVQGRHEAPTRGVRQVQDTYNGYKVGTRPLHGYEAGMNHLLGVRGGYKIPKRWVQDTYKGYQAGMTTLKGV